MKLLSCILSVYILFLAVAPGMSFTASDERHSTCQSSCCSEKKSDESRKSGTDCEKGGCNVFMSCCNGFALHREASRLLLPPVISGHLFQAPSGQPSSDYMAEAWHPPKQAGYSF